MPADPVSLGREGDLIASVLSGTAAAARTVANRIYCESGLPEQAAKLNALRPRKDEARNHNLVNGIFEVD